MPVETRRSFGTHTRHVIVNDPVLGEMCRIHNTNAVVLVIMLVKLAAKRPGSDEAVG